MKQTKITREESAKLLESKWWEGKTPTEIALFQLQVDRLSIPWDMFHSSVEKALGREVQTIEFTDPEHLILEIEGKEDAPSGLDIIKMTMNAMAGKK